jgi:hypothetical protein
MKIIRMCGLVLGALAFAGCGEPEPAGPSHPIVQFLPNDPVQIVSDAFVKSGPSAFSSAVGEQARGATGLITTTPSVVDTDGDDTRYWEVNFTSGVDGWVSGIYLMPAQEEEPVGFFVSPTGSSGNLGTFASPWDLATAFSGAGGEISAGETVWILGGTYVAPSGKYTIPATLDGTSSAPITFRAYPGEQPVLEDAVSGTITHLKVKGSYVVVWGLEFWNSSTGSGRTSDRPNVIWNSGSHNRYVNLVVHDGSVGFLNDPDGTDVAEDVEIIGSIFYNNGWQNTGLASPNNRGHGHGLYLKNNSTTTWVVARDNILFNQFSHGIHVYTDAGNSLNRIRLTGNVAFNNGTLAAPISSPSPGRNVIFGGVGTVSDGEMDANMTYYSPDIGPVMGPNVTVGYQSTVQQSLQLTNNYLVGGGAKLGTNPTHYPVLDVGYWNSLTLSNNSFIHCQPQSTCGSTSRIIKLNAVSTTGHAWSGNTHFRAPTETSWVWNGTAYTFTAWKTAASITTTDGTSTASPTVTQVFVRNVLYQGSATGRANIVVYNWGNDGSVNVNLSGIVPSGKAFDVRNVQNRGVVVASGTGGITVNIPITSVSPPAPVGITSLAPSTGTRFNVYFVSWIP